MDESDDGDSDFLIHKDRYLLQDRYLELAREALPREARRHNWVVSNDHCFMRILLDHACGGCWYDRLDTRLRAYKQLTNDQLEVAVRLAEKMLAEGEAVVIELNRQSLRWRTGRQARGVSVDKD